MTITNSDVLKYYKMMKLDSNFPYSIFDTLTREQYHRQFLEKIMMLTQTNSIKNKRLTKLIQIHINFIDKVGLTVTPTREMRKGRKKNKTRKNKK